MSFSTFVRAVIDGELDLASRLLTANPEFAAARFEAGATRRTASEHFYQDIAHYAYRGDTALHLAAAAFQRSSVELLVRHASARLENLTSERTVEALTGPA